MSNTERLGVLRALIDEEDPIDGIHNEDVRRLYRGGGSCPRYLGCTSEGSGESSHRNNPDFFAGELGEVAKWLASSYEEGWAANWVTDLDDPRAPAWTARLQWSVAVQVPRRAGVPTMIETGELTGAANDALQAYLQRLVRAEAKGRLGEEIGIGVAVDLAIEIVNRALGRGAAQLGSTRRLIGLGRAGAAAA